MEHMQCFVRASLHAKTTVSLPSQRQDSYDNLAKFQFSFHRVFKDMIALCERICPDDIHDLLSDLKRVNGVTDPPILDREG